jgi:bifunctional UDP-N-acetylglucosamine pyrophosphorylase/glucosamine-1-phosphate N-acetyltransferase
VVLGFRPDDPAEYGRLVTAADGGLEAIVEFKDASAAQREIGLCNAGIMAIDGNHLFALLDSVGNDNANGEYYLTDIVELARDRGLRCDVVEAADPVEVMGVNSRAQLAAAEAAMQARLRDRAMTGGVTMTDPETVWLSADTKIGRDVIIGPNVFFGTGVTIADNVEIKAFCHIDGAEVASGVSIGPFARLRPGAKLERNVHVGNFVEIKQALVEEGAKVNHLSYVGDAYRAAGKCRRRHDHLQL